MYECCCLGQARASTVVLSMCCQADSAGAAQEVLQFCAQLQQQGHVRSANPGRWLQGSAFAPEFQARPPPDGCLQLSSCSCILSKSGAHALSSTQ